MIFLEIGARLYTIFQPFQFEPEQRKKQVVIRAMRKKINIFKLQQSIYCKIGNIIKSVGANAGIAKTKQEKSIVFVVER